MIRIYIFVQCILFWLSFNANGQSQIPLLQLNKSLSQSNQINPALFPEFKVIIGLPVISSTYVSVNADNVSFNDVFTRRSDDSLAFDTTRFVSRLDKINSFDVNSEITLFYLGLRLNRNYLSIALNEKVNGRITYGKEAIEWLLFGPGDSRNIGKNFNLDEFGGKFTYYHELAAGYGRQFTDKLYLGARLKLLSGVVNFDAEGINGLIHSSIDSIHVENDAFEINTAGIDNFENNIEDQILGFGNTGMAFDFGAKYQVNNKFSVNASLNDLGYISWNKNTTSYQINNVNYTFRGFDILDLLNEDPATSDEFTQQEIDSLENLYDPIEVTGIKYSSSLIPKLYLGANYEIMGMHNFGATFYSDFFKGDVNTAIGVSYGLKLGRILNTVVSATYKNGSFNNIGGGLSLRLGGVQIYAVSENALSAFFPARAKRLDARIGLNLTFGRTKDKKPKRKKKDMEEVLEEDTLTIETPEEELPLPDTTQSEEIQEIIEEEDTVMMAIPSDTLETVPVIEEDTLLVIPEKDTVQIKEDTVVVVPEDKVVEEVAEEPVEEEEVPVIVKKGDHPLELGSGHYVIVGAFEIEENARTYSRRLIGAGFDNNIGYNTEKGLFYIYTYYHPVDIERTREERDKYRDIPQFLFENAWVLSVE